MVVRALYEALAAERNLARDGEMREQRVRVGLERRRVGDLEDVGQVPVSLLEVEAVADDEAVGAIEPDVARAEGHDPAHRLVEQGEDLERSRSASPEDR